MVLGELQVWSLEFSCKLFELINNNKPTKKDKGIENTGVFYIYLFRNTYNWNVLSYVRTNKSYPQRWKTKTTEFRWLSSFYCYDKIQIEYRISNSKIFDGFKFNKPVLLIVWNSGTSTVNIYWSIVLWYYMLICDILANEMHPYVMYSKPNFGQSQKRLAEIQLIRISSVCCLTSDIFISSI